MNKSLEKSIKALTNSINKVSNQYERNLNLKIEMASSCTWNNANKEEASMYEKLMNDIDYLVSSEEELDSLLKKKANIRSLLSGFRSDMDLNLGLDFDPFDYFDESNYPSPSNKVTYKPLDEMNYLEKLGIIRKGFIKRSTLFDLASWFSSMAEAVRNGLATKEQMLANPFKS